MAGAAALLLFVADEPAAALVLAVAAVALPVVSGTRRPSRPTGDGSMAGLAALARGLGIEGHGVHAFADGAPRLFLPAGRAGPLPELHRDQVLHRGPGRLGVSVPPPGAPLLRRWEQESGLPRGGGDVEAADHVRRALPRLGLGAAVAVDAGPRLRVRYRPLAHADACRTAREELAPWHVQGGCPTCSFVALLAAAAHGAPVRFAAAGTDEEGRTLLELETVG